MKFKIKSLQINYQETGDLLCNPQLVSYAIDESMKIAVYITARYRETTEVFQFANLIKNEPFESDGSCLTFHMSTTIIKFMNISSRGSFEFNVGLKESIYTDNKDLRANVIDFALDKNWKCRLDNGAEISSSYYMARLDQTGLHIELEEGAIFFPLEYDKQLLAGAPNPAMTL